MLPDIYIGIMSGTSLDGIDVAAIRINDQFSFLAAECVKIPDDLHQQILTLTQPGNNEIEHMGRLDIALGKIFAKTVNRLISTANIDTKEIAAIGSHGQTIRHRPTAEFTLQIGDPNTIAEQTGLTTIADFRRRDIANGGQGAPLVPAFHNNVFRSIETNRMILNIGGMANITVLPANPASLVTGFDTGPGNILSDAWIHQHSGEPYDEDGSWARTGSVNQDLLQHLLSLPFFSETAPKSTGREQFHIGWIQQVIQENKLQIEAVDVQATLLELTACSIADSINMQHLTDPELYICGGGVHNHALIQRLRELTSIAHIATTEALGLHPDWVEASAFAWLAHQTLNKLTGNLPSVTGAAEERILGGIYQA